jgi:hypothetical protein
MKLYSVFDLNGMGVTGQLFHSKDDAAEYAEHAELVAEYGPCHAGVPCSDHDESEQGLCYHCVKVIGGYNRDENAMVAGKKIYQQAESGPILKSSCDECGLFASHESFCSHFVRVSRLETEYVPTFWRIRQ